MRHQRLRRKLGVKTKHRKALLRNLLKGLVIHKRIRTTLAKAKEASSFADQMVTLAKRGDLHARRLLIRRLGSDDIARALIKEIAPHFQDRQGGYTRVLHLGSRNGDGSAMALLEFSTFIEALEKPKKPKKEKKPKAPKPEQAEGIPEKPKKEKAKPKELEVPSEEKKEKKKEEKEEKKETEKKGGFLNALRRFLKGDDQ